MVSDVHDLSNDDDDDVINNDNWTDNDNLTDGTFSSDENDYDVEDN